MAHNQQVGWTYNDSFLSGNVISLMKTTWVENRQKLLKRVQELKKEVERLKRNRPTTRISVREIASEQEKLSVHFISVLMAEYK